MAFGLNVTYKMKPGKTPRFLELVAQCGLQAAVRGEEGCLKYDYFLPAEQKDELLLVERWTSREAQQIHLNQPHMAAIQGIKAECVEEVRLELYDLPD